MLAQAIRSAVFTITADPFFRPSIECFTYLPDAILGMENGKITLVEAYSPEVARNFTVVEYANSLTCAGFIDGHIHCGQTEIIGSYATGLLEWLERHAFIAEQKFKDKKHADKIAAIFLRELLRSGTTTASVFCTVHKESADAFFEESSRYNTRMLAGKVLMDRGAPSALTDTAQSGYADSRALMERWHGQGRQLYAITPRFAPTSTPKQLTSAGKLWREHPGVYMQTHLYESKGEIELVKKLFPCSGSYLDIYEDAGIVGHKSIFAHCIHMTEEEFLRLHKAGAGITHCPTSNLFLGSGFFRTFEAKKPERPVRTGVSTDIGGGTSFSMLQTLNEAHKVAQCNQTGLDPVQAWYLATRGSAESLYLEDKIGTLAPGYEADLAVFDLAATPLLQFRLESLENILDKLFVLMTLGDDRAVRATYVAGQCVYDKTRPEQFVYPR